MDREEVISLMRRSNSREEWNANAGIVKRLNGGYYPGFWYEAILQSGVMGDFERRMETRDNATVRAVYP